MPSPTRAAVPRLLERCVRQRIGEPAGAPESGFRESDDQLPGDYPDLCKEAASTCRKLGVGLEKGLVNRCEYCKWRGNVVI